MRVCDNCGAPLNPKARICTCYFPATEIFTDEQLSAYCGQMLQQRPDGDNLQGRWRWRLAMNTTVNGYIGQLINSGQLVVPTRMNNGYYSTPSGFVSRENPGILKVTQSGFTSAWQPSEDVLLALEDIEASCINGEDQYGVLTDDGLCRKCGASAHPDDVICGECFAPTVPISINEARELYLEKLGERQASMEEQEAAGVDLDTPEASAEIASLENAYSELQTWIFSSIPSTTKAEDEARKIERKGQKWPWAFLIPVLLSGLYIFLWAYQKGWPSHKQYFFVGLPLAMIVCWLVFRKYWIRCRHCGSFQRRSRAFSYSNVRGFSRGSHIENRFSQSYTTHRDSRGNYLGSSNSLHQELASVEHETEHGTAFYHCGYCYRDWSEEYARQYNI